VALLRGHRRCCTETALQKLTVLRARVQRFTSVGRALQTLFSSALERALTFLDESSPLRGHTLLPATSNAVERGNRRYRKMQNSVYRVRAHQSGPSRPRGPFEGLGHRIIGRLALDLWRDVLTHSRSPFMLALHLQRAAS
jgi:hypothetical protein